MSEQSKNKLTLTMQFDMDGSDTFARFCKALIDGGFEDAVRMMGRDLITEAERRGIPWDKELEEGIVRKYERDRT